jgi:hypothetical protein
MGHPSRTKDFRGEIKPPRTKTLVGDQIRQTETLLGHGTGFWERMGNAQQP